MAPINVCVIIRGELAIGRIFAPHTSHEDGTVKARPEPQLLFCYINQTLLMLALWSCGRRASVVQAQRQIHRVLPAACTSRYRIRARAHLLTAALMPAEPHIRSPFSERLAPQSLILKVIGLGRVGPHCMAAYRSHCSRRSTRPDPRG